MLNGLWAGMILLGVVYGTLTGRLADVTNAALDSAQEAITLCLTMAGVVALWMGLMEIAGRAGLVDKMTQGIRPFLHFLFPRIPRDHPALGYIATNVIANILGLGWACTPAGLKAMEELANLEAERGTPGYGGEEYGGERYGERRHGGEEHDGERHGGTEHGGKRYGADRYDETGTAGKAGRGISDFRKQTQRTASAEMCNFLILNISSLQLIPVNMIAYRSQYGSEDPARIIAPAIAATLVSTVTALVYCKWKDGCLYGTHGRSV